MTTLCGPVWSFMVPVYPCGLASFRGEVHDSHPSAFPKLFGAATLATFAAPIRDRIPSVNDMRLV